MKIIQTLKEIPQVSLIHKGMSRIDYFDSFQIESHSQESVDSITTQFFSLPKWIQNLMTIRNKSVAIFGLQGDSELSEISMYYPIGSRAVMFTVLDRNDSEIVMGESDVHLDFKTSVLIQKNDLTTCITSTTVVVYHNFWGRLYFFFVKPFHRIIIKTLLKKIKRLKD